MKKLHDRVVYHCWLALLVALGNLPVSVVVGMQTTESSKESAGSSTTEQKDSEPDELDRGLLDDLLPSETERPADANSPKNALHDADTDAARLLGPGEDVGAGPNPLADIASRMLAVRTRFARQDTSQETQGIQQGIVADLDRLIEQLDKQNGNQSSSRSATPPPQDPPQQPDSTPPNSGQPSPAAATQPGTATPGDESADQVARTMQRIWGHLPPRMRPPVMQSNSERFLPQYESLIERYYERLAEQPKRTDTP